MTKPTQLILDCRLSSILSAVASGIVAVCMPLSLTSQRANEYRVGHFNHQPTGLAYNGVKPEVEKLIQEFGNEDKSQAYPTLNRRSSFVENVYLKDHHEAHVNVNS